MIYIAKLTLILITLTTISFVYAEALRGVSQGCIKQVISEYPFPQINEALISCSKVDMSCVEDLMSRYPYPNTHEAIPSCKLERNRDCELLLVRQVPSLQKIQLINRCSSVNSNCLRETSAVSPFPSVIDILNSKSCHYL